MDSLVTTSWLAGRLDDPGIIILDATLPPVGVTPPVDTRARYDAKHIPGAVFFDIEELSDHSNPLPHMLPPPDVFSRKVSALGIGDQTDIVIYEQEGVFSGPRAWWTLRPSAPKMFTFSTAGSAPGPKLVSPRTLEKFIAPRPSSTPDSIKTQ